MPRPLSHMIRPMAINRYDKAARKALDHFGSADDRSESRVQLWWLAKLGASTLVGVVLAQVPSVYDWMSSVAPGFKMGTMGSVPAVQVMFFVIGLTLSLVVQVVISVRQTIAKALERHEEVAASLIAATVTEEFNNAILRTLAPDSKLGPDVMMDHLIVCHRYLASVERVPAGLQLVARKLALTKLDDVRSFIEQIQQDGVQLTADERLTINRELVAHSGEYTAIDACYLSVPSKWQRLWIEFIDELSRDSGVKKRWVILASDDEFASNKVTNDENIAYLTTRGWNCFRVNPAHLASEYNDTIIPRLLKLGSFFEKFGDMFKAVEVVADWQTKSSMRTTLRSLSASRVDREAIEAIEGVLKGGSCRLTPPSASA